MKYTKEEKIEWVMQYLSGMPLRYPPGVEKANFKRKIRYLAKRYQAYGEAALEHKKKRRFTIEQMLRAVSDCQTMSRMEVALRFEIETSVLLNWTRTYSEKGLDGLKSLAEHHGRPKMKKDITPSQEAADETQEEKMARLERELLEARTEIALLKKVKALTEGKKVKDRGR